MAARGLHPPAQGWAHTTRAGTFFAIPLIAAAPPSLVPQSLQVSRTTELNGSNADHELGPLQDNVC